MLTEKKLQEKRERKASVRREKAKTRNRYYAHGHAARASEQTKAHARMKELAQKAKPVAQEGAEKYGHLQAPQKVKGRIVSRVVGSLARMFGARKVIGS